MGFMTAWSSFWLAFSLPLLLLQGLVQDPVRAPYSNAMAAAEGLTALVSRLDAVAKSGQGSAILPQVVETIQVIPILYPGWVPDGDARLQAMMSAAAANPALVRAKDCPDATVGTRDGLSNPALAERRLQTLKRQSR